MNKQGSGPALYGPALFAGAVMFLPRVRGIFYARGGRWLYIVLFSFLLSFLLTPLMRRLALSFSVLDQPAQRKVHKNAIPLLGGLAVYLAFIISILANNILTPALNAILLAASMVMLISLVDDIRPLSAKLKLAVQLIAAILVFFAGIRITIFPVTGAGGPVALLMAAANFAVTFLWIVGITNAMNFLDGTDGLATGLGIVISFFLGIVAYETGQTYLGWLAAAMAGGCLGFLPYNFRRTGPALIFLGDTGSTFIGFTLACLAIMGDWSRSDPLVSICTPIMIFGVLIFDMTHTTVARIATGKVRGFQDWVAYTGKDHIHHRMYRIFRDNKKTVLLILAISACLGISAVILPHADLFDSLLIVSQGILAFLMFSALNYYQDRTLEAFREKRAAFRMQILFEVRAEVLDEDKRVDGFVLNLSEGGAKLLINSLFPIAIGDILKIRAKEFGDDELRIPRGRVMWRRDMMANEYPPGYVEYGVQFQERIRQDIEMFIESIQKKQLKRQFGPREMLNSSLVQDVL